MEFLRRLRAAVVPLGRFAKKGAVTPELEDQRIREIRHEDYRIIYKYFESRVLIETVKRASPPRRIEVYSE